MTAHPAPHACCDAAKESLRERKKRATRHQIHEVALRLIGERGAAGVTVEEICDEVGVAPRTFFNDYPTKLDAAFDIPQTDIPDASAERFLQADGDLLSDALALVASSTELPGDFLRIKALLHEHPDLAFTFWKQLIGRLKPVHALMEQRSDDPPSARLAFALMVVAALSSMVRPREQADTNSSLDRLLAEVGAMKALLGGIDVPHPAEDAQ